VSFWLKARIVELTETAGAMERLCKQTPVARQRLGGRHVIAATVAHASIAELLEAVFYVQSEPRLYSVEELPKQAVQLQKKLWS
jgi:hypothetical protein